MKKLTVTVDNNANAAFLSKLLKSLDFVKTVEPEKKDDELSKEQIKELESRWKAYKKNPEKAKSWAEVESQMKAKYGF